MSNAIEIHDLTVAYDIKPVLWDVELHFPKGRLVAIIGPNGAGKSTLIKAMMGLLKPISGTIIFNNHEDVNKKIAYVPQSGSVDWDFPTTAIDVVLMGRYGHLGWFKRPTKQDVEIAKSMLAKVGMLDFANRQISQLSGGQQQRVFLARALVQEADIYLMDEPFKGVDVQTAKVIVELLKELQSQQKTVLVVHHDLQTVTSTFDWVTLINLQVVANGLTKDVFTSDNIAKTYHGLDVWNK